MGSYKSFCLSKKENYKNKFLGKNLFQIQFIAYCEDGQEEPSEKLSKYSMAWSTIATDNCSSAGRTEREILAGGMFQHNLKRQLS